MNFTEIKVPDIGDFQDVEIIEIICKIGDKILPEDLLISVESDKATMEVPSPSAGIVREIKVKVGDKVQQIATISANGDENIGTLISDAFDKVGKDVEALQFNTSISQMMTLLSKENYQSQLTKNKQ